MSDNLSSTNTCHRMKISFRCKTCGKIFPSRDQVKAHLRIHDLEKKDDHDSDSNNTIANNNEKSASNQVPTSKPCKDSPSTKQAQSQTKQSNRRMSFSSLHLNHLQFENDAFEKEDDDDSLPGYGDRMMIYDSLIKQSDDSVGLNKHDNHGNDQEEDNLSKSLYSCVCGKSYFVQMSLDAHQKWCPKLNPKRSHIDLNLLDSPVTKNRSRLINNDLDSPSSSCNKSLLADDDKSTQFRRDLIEQLHADGDPHCKSCNKTLSKGLMSICGHLSRRVDCRKYYQEKLLPHLGLINPSPPVPFFRASSIDEHEPLKLKISRGKNVVNGCIIKPLDKKNSLPTTPTRSKRIAAQNKSEENLFITRPANITMPVTQVIRKRPTVDNPGEILVAPDNELISRAYLVRNSVQCPKCLKIFRGKTPAVAYNNHRRNKHCPVAGSKALFMRSKVRKSGHGSSNDSISSPPSPSNLSAEENDQSSFSSSPTSLQNQENKKDPKSSDQPAQQLEHIKYFCKLCHNKEVKNRVSLGVHLTTYHGLPPVNITYNGTVALRCQTCTKVFVSKYFYNMHRYECDLTSPYIGISNAEVA